MTRPFSLAFKQKMVEQLEAFLGCKVDLATYGGLRAERIGRFTASLP